MLVVLVGCDAGTAPGGVDASALDAGRTCAADSECDDGLYCTGVERCAPGATTADARGCLAGVAPCAAGARCDETADACDTCPDADGDGSRDATCGGDDCDDADATRFPSSPEVCDASHDEDCDPMTVGGLDADRDGVIAAACCNGAVCGGDCDDANAAVGGGFADGPPGACDMLDNDCDLAIDEGCECTPGATRPCGPMEEIGVCRRGTQTCGAGTWGACMGAVEPAALDACNGSDDDCDMGIDEGFPCRVGETRDCDTACGDRGAQVCLPDCSRFGACAIADEVCGPCDDDDDGSIDEGFECRGGSAGSCVVPTCGTMGMRSCGSDCRWVPCVAPEVCNYCDDDGNGSFAGVEIPAAVSSRVIGLPCGRTVGAAGACFTEDPVGVIVEQYQPIVGSSGAGAIWLLEDDHMGYGTLDIRVRVRARRTVAGVPDGGWALVLAQSDGSDLGAASDLGVPRDRRGLAIEWHHRDVILVSGSEVDSIRVRTLAGGYFGRVPAPREHRMPSSGSLDSGTPIGTWVTQDLRVVYTPDDPTMLGETESLQVYTGGSGSPLWSLVYDTNGASDDYIQLSHSMVGGDPLEIAVVAGAGSLTGDIQLHVLSIDIRPGMPATPRATLSLQRTCP